MAAKKPSHRLVEIAGLCEMSTHRKRPRDFSQAAKLVIDIATGQIEDRPPTPEEQGKDPAAVAFEASQKRAA